MVHVTALSVTSFYLSKKTQIRALLANEAPIKVPPEYSDYTDIFLSDLAIDLPEHSNINNYTINLVKNT